jgi:hypothetical protein
MAAIARSPFHADRADPTGPRLGDGRRKLELLVEVATEVWGGV